MERLEAIGDEIWAAAEHAFFNTNKISFKQMLRSLRQYHEDTKLSTLTLCDIFGTENPSLINAIPREEFIARVNAKKQDLDLPLTSSESELAERRAKQDAARAEQDAARAAEAERLLALERRTRQQQGRLYTIRQTQKVQAERAANGGKAPTFKLHDECSIAFPEDHFLLNFYVHVSGHRPGKAGQPPTPVKRASPYCPSMTACTDCQKWVRKVALGTASLEAPGAGWAPSRDQILGVAARVRAALPGTFGDVELPEVPGRKSKAPKSKAAEPPARSSKRARKATKVTDV